MRNLHHLQILHDEEVEGKLRRLIPQIESWLLGTLPLARSNETKRTGPGVVFPVVDGVDIPLAPIRKLIYKGVADYTLLRTQHATITPANFSKADYTVLRIEGEPKIGGKALRPAKSIWIEQPATIDAGFIFIIMRPAEILVGRDNSV